MDNGPSSQWERIQWISESYNYQLQDSDISRTRYLNVHESTRCENNEGIYRLQPVCFDFSILFDSERVLNAPSKIGPGLKIERDLYMARRVSAKMIADAPRLKSCSGISNHTIIEALPNQFTDPVSSSETASTRKTASPRRKNWRFGDQRRHFSIFSRTRHDIVHSRRAWEKASEDSSTM